MLCRACSNIHFRHLQHCRNIPDDIIEHFRRNDYGPSNYIYYFLQPDWQSLEASAANGCQFCTMLINAPSSQGPNSKPNNHLKELAGTWVYLQRISPLHTFYRLDDDEWDVSYDFEGFCESRAFKGNVSYIGKGPWEGMLKKLSRYDPGNVDAIEHASDAIFSPVQDKSTGSSASLALAREWLHTCTHSHKHCAAQGDPEVLPRRVIELSTGSLRLVRGTGRKGRYAALSYTWGSGPHFKTTKQNIEQHESAISLHHLPLVLQQAVLVAFELGFSYLWIDAVCIVQDDPADKDVDISNMDKVYQNATVTIFAASANDTIESFFKPRDPRSIKPCRIAYQTTTGETHLHHQRYVTFHDDFTLMREPLFQRGWVMQEQVLSTRGLIFAKDSLKWSCLEGEATETRPRLINRSMAAIPPERTTLFGEDWFYSLRRSLETEVEPTQAPSASLKQKTQHLSFWRMLEQEVERNRAPLTPLEQRTQNFNSWYSMVESYSTRSLTVKADALDAVRGVANAFASKHGCQFYAGLWLEDLQHGLCWFVVHPMPYYQPSRTVSTPAQTDWTKPNKIPTWSWVFRFGNAIRSAEKGEIGFTEKPNNPFGLAPKFKELISRNQFPVTSELVVKSLLLDVRILPRDVKKPKEGPRSWDGTTFYDPIDLGRWLRAVVGANSEQVIGQIAFDCASFYDSITSVTCLLCTMRIGDATRRLCLALDKLTDSNSRIYRRVGLVSLWNDDIIEQLSLKEVTII